MGGMDCGSPFFGDEIVGVDPRYRVRPRIGENKKRGDVLRRWVHWKSTDRVDSLYNPLIGHRRQSEWDDHSETYPQSFTGPNLVVDVTVPKGWQEVAFYFFNKDGETGNNFRRDYFVTARRNTGISEKPLAATRVTRFRNGVYKRFAVQGPGTFVFEVERDNSFSTILSGVFVRKILERPEVQSSPRLSTCAHFGGLVYREPSLGESDMFQRDVDGCRIGSDYDIVLGKYISRYRASHASEDSAEARLMRWNLRIWNDDDRYRFDQSMLAAWTCLQMKSPKYRNAKFFPDSPNVLHRDPLPGDYSVESPLHWIEDAGVVNPRPVRKSDGDFYLRVVNLHGTGEYLND